jgi:hypothetical protein
MAATQRGATPKKPVRQTEARSWQIPGFDEPFVQDPLSFFERNELLGMIAGALDQVAKNAGDMAGLLSSLDLDEVSMARLKRGQVSSESLQAANIIGLVTRLATQVPRLLEDIYLLALSVPPERRDAVRDGLHQIDDDTGFGIFETFVEQNLETLQAFVVRWWEQVRQAIQRLSPQPSDTSAT